MNTPVVRRLIEMIITHLHPHLDEFLTIFLVKMFGKDHFDLSPSLSYGYICGSAGPECEAMYPQHLFLGVARGEFDDHGLKKQFSCCELMARKLNIFNHPYLFKILQAVGFQDKNMAKKKLHRTFPKTISLLHRYEPEKNILEIQAWVEESIVALMHSEERFWKTIVLEVSADNDVLASDKQREMNARFWNKERSWYYLTLDSIAAEIDPSRREAWLAFPQVALSRQQQAFDLAKFYAPPYVFSLPSRFGETKTLIIDGSANDLFNPFILEFDSVSRTDIGASLTVVRDGQGHTLVAANQTFQGNLKTFVRRLRLAEAHKRNIPLSQDVLARLEDEGTVNPIESWFVHEKIGYMRIYSGSTTRPTIDLSELSVEEIYGLIADWLRDVPIRLENILPMKVQQAA